MVRVALMFYAVMAAVAIAVGSVRDLPIWWDGSTPRLAFWGAVGGASFGGIVALETRSRIKTSRSLQNLYAFFATALGPVSWREAFVLAVCSAIGEELLFRGVVQLEWGLGAATLLFGFAHIPPRPDLWSWTAFALVVGLVLGLLRDYSGNLIGPIVAHFVINFFNLELAGRVARGEPV